MDLAHAGHLLAGGCAFVIALCLVASGLSYKARGALARNQDERTHNFLMVALFLFGLSLDLSIAAFSGFPEGAGVADSVHIGAVILTSLTGMFASLVFLTRLAMRWKF